MDGFDSLSNITAVSKTLSYAETRSNFPTELTTRKTIEVLYMQKGSYTVAQSFFGTTTSSLRYLGVFVNSTPYAALQYNTNRSGTYYLGRTTIPLRDGAFVHLVGVRTNAYPIIYINQQLVSSNLSTAGTALGADTARIGYRTATVESIANHKLFYVNWYEGDLSGIVNLMYKERFNPVKKFAVPIASYNFNQFNGFLPDVSGNGNDMNVSGNWNVTKPVQDVDDW